jgi:23S rRNA pseudouridine2457 synthase
MHRYFAIYKPYDMVSQFVSSHNVTLLGSLDFEFPKGIHAIGRLDNHSEGLLLLTTNQQVTRLLFQGEKPHARKYLVQVKNKMNQLTAMELSNGILIEVAGGEKYMTTACNVELVSRPIWLQPAAYEISANLPHSWLEISLTEGKFHQVRKMVAAVHHKCRRLVRLSIEDISIAKMQPGDVMELSEKDFFEQLHIDYPIE